MTAKNMLRMASLIILIAVTLPANSSTIIPGFSQTNSPAKTEDPRAQQLLQRLEEIKSMNKSELTRLEKKNLQKEVRGIKKEMRNGNRGVYLSVGAIIIIVLLLILLL